jgi:hypothetical protein
MSLSRGSGFLPDAPPDAGVMAEFLALLAGWFAFLQRPGPRRETGLRQ